jgi:hypothetical protein
MGRFAAMDRRVTWPPAKPLDGFCGVLFGIAENVAKRGRGLPIRRACRARQLWKRPCSEPISRALGGVRLASATSPSSASSAMAPLVYVSLFIRSSFSAVSVKSAAISISAIFTYAMSVSLARFIQSSACCRYTLGVGIVALQHASLRGAAQPPITGVRQEAEQRVVLGRMRMTCSRNIRSLDVSYQRTSGTEDGTAFSVVAPFWTARSPPFGRMSWTIVQ